MYRDCYNIAPGQTKPTEFDPTIEVGIYYDNSGYNQYNVITISLSSETSITPPSGGSGCSFVPNVCIKKGIYTSVITLPKSNSGYYLLHERCCRNNLNNLIGDQGQSYFTYIPPQSYRNNSPYFTGAPTPYICYNDTVDISYAASDKDGDSLSYDFVVPYHGGSGSVPVPPPPYYLTLPVNDVTYASGYSLSNPFGSGGLAYIDYQTGLVTIKSPNSGLFALAVEVSEFRNGVLLSKVRRDIEIIVLACPVNNPPRFITGAGSVYRVDAGDTLKFNITYSDIDSIYITHKNSTLFGPPGNPPYASLPNSAGKIYASTQFSWITSCAQASVSPYRITVYARDNGCPYKTRINNFDIYVKPPKPPDSISGKKTVCSLEENVDYQVWGLDTLATIRWQVSGGTITAGQNTKKITVNWGNSSPGKVTAIQKNIYGCETNVGIFVTIYARPMVEAGDDKSLCSGNKITLGGLITDPSYTYEWLPKDSLLNPNNPSTLLSYINPSDFPLTLKYYLKITNPNQCSSIDSISIVINPKPVKQAIIGNTPVCHRSVQTYFVPSHLSYTYNWMVSGGTKTTANANTVNILLTDSNLATLKLIESNVFGCKSDTAVFKVNIITPKPVIQGPRVVCPNSQPVLYQVKNPGIGSVYKWGCKNGRLQPGIWNISTINILWAEEGAAMVWVVETTKEGCKSDTSFFPVKLSYHLETSFIDGDTILCEFSKNNKYSVYETNGSSYNWIIYNGYLASADGKSDVLVDWLSEGKGHIKVLESAYDSVNNKACYGDTVLLNVTLNPLPETSPISGPSETCQLLPVTYSVQGFPGSVFTWSISGSNSFSGQGTNQIQLDWKNEGTYTLSVFETTKDNCTGTIIDTEVVVYPKPRTTPIQGDSVICYPDNNSMVYSVSGFPRSTYQWTATGGNLINNSSVDSVEVEWTAGEYGTLSVVELSEHGCVGDVLKMNVVLDSLRSEIELVTTAVKNDQIIESYLRFYNSAHMEKKARFFKSVPGEQSWIVIDSFYSSKTNHVDSFVSTHSKVYDYKISVFNLCGKIFSSEPHHSILLRGEKISDFMLDLRWNLYTGWETGVNRYDIYRAINENREFFPFDSNFNDTMALIETGNDGYKQCYRVVAVQNGNENVKSWSNEICFNFEPKVYVPTAFSPNNDGINDIFKVITGNVAEFELSIYNRWGQRIFYTNVLGNGWDGTYQGKACPVDVYMVLVKYSGSSHNLTYTGSVTLLK